MAGHSHFYVGHASLSMNNCYMCNYAVICFDEYDYDYIVVCM